MPIYEYQCAHCGAISEVLQRIHDKPLKKCDKCGGGLEKLISRTSFQLRGTGWYVTDYARKGKPGGESGGSSGGGDASSSGGSSSDRKSGSKGSD